MGEYFINPHLLILFTILLGTLNLLAPFVSREDSFLRSWLLLSIGIFFFISVLIIDWLFLAGIRASFTIFVLQKYSFALHLEALGIIFLNLLAVLWVAALMYTVKYLVINKIKNSSVFLFFLNLSVLAGVFIALSANLFTMFTCYELLTLATIPLITHKIHPIPAAVVTKGISQYLKILLLSSMILFLPAIIIIYAKAGNGDFINGGFIQAYFSKHSSLLLLLMLIFGISKSALWPLHQWLPAAMVASYPVSSLLHAVVVVKSGLFCTIKILVYVFGLDYLQAVFGAYNWLIIFPVITIFHSAFVAMKSDNIKIILAYSTINNLSITLLSAFMLTPKAIGAAMLHMVSHSFSKICLFYAAGSMYSLANIRQVKDLIGMSSKMPKTSAIFLIASMSLIGVPPFAGFISKFYILLAAAEQNNIIVMILIALSTFLSGLYMAKLLIFIYKPIAASPLKAPTEKLEKDLPFLMLLSLSLCGGGVVFFVLIQKFINHFLLYI